jgi:exopolysaccharide production protein ExoQ
MRTMTHALSIDSRAIPAPLLFPRILGFFFVARVGLTFLFFQSNPVTGTIVTIAAGLALLFGAILYTAGGAVSRSSPFDRIRPLQWIFALLGLSLASIFWTGAQSRAVAFAYWIGMAADIVIVLLLLRRGDAGRFTRNLFEGAVLGASALALVAWCSPLTADLRLGNDAFLHPNTLGLEIGIATLLAQYLALADSRWKWLAFALGATLLRSLSKTAIIAFVIAESWYLLHNKDVSRRAKLRLAFVAAIIVAASWGALTAYLDVYNNTGSGNQAETLTGRTVLWAVAFSMSMQRPWLGHGIYSFRALIPSFGAFQAVHAHNEMLQQFFEYGAAGVAIVVALYFSFYRLARRAQPGSLRNLALTLLVFALIRGLTDTTNFGLSYPLWLLAALSVCLSNAEPLQERAS